MWTSQTLPQTEDRLPLRAGVLVLTLLRWDFTSLPLRFLICKTEIKTVMCWDS